MPRRTDDDFADEIRAHLDHEADRLIAEGLDGDAARLAARRAFGNVVAARERFHDRSRWIWFEQLTQDLRYACRTLAHSPAFASTTIVALAIGLALTTGVFTVFNAYLLRPFAVRDPGNLYRLAWHTRDAAGSAVRWQDYEAVAARRDLFADALAESTRYVSYESYEARPLAAELVSGSYFSMLGPEMHAGRPLDRGDENSPVVVLSHHAWSSLLHRDPAVIGREMTLSGRRFTVVGVLGPDFAGLHGMPRDIWIPFRAYAEAIAANLLDESASVVTVSVRLQDGVTAQQARNAVTPLVADAKGPESHARAELRRQDRPVALSLQMVALLSPVFAAFALVLLAACANVSSVMLARAVARQREIAVRLSLGAARERIVRQLLTEGLVISMLAVLVALGLTAAGLRLATTIFFATLPPSLAAILRTAPLAIDHRVFLFATGAALASTLAFALIPAIQASRARLTGSLTTHGSHSQRGASLRAFLVAGQVAASLLLVIPALTLARNGSAVRNTDVGFDIANVISIHVREGNAADLTRKAVELLKTDPRVTHAAVSNGNPLFGPPPVVALESQGIRTPTPFTFVSPGYFATLRIPIVRGRGFRDDEGQTEARVALVSEATARTFWPRQNPIGQHLVVGSSERPDERFAQYSKVTVVGTVGDIISGLVVDGPEAGHIYLPTFPGSARARALLARVRTSRDLSPATWTEILKPAASDPEVFETLPLEEVRSLQVYPFMAASWIGSFLGVVALVLSISGLFGVLTYTLAQRSREIGIRMALGATTRTVVGMVMRQTARLAGLGAIAGTVGAFALLQFLSTLVRLRAVSLLDAVAFAAGLAVVALSALIAAYQPARRAARVDPAQTLRADS